MFWSETVVRNVGSVINFWKHAKRSAVYHEFILFKHFRGNVIVSNNFLTPCAAYVLRQDAKLLQSVDDSF